MKVWITRYALSSGIKEADDGQQITPTMIKYGGHHYAHRQDWHITREKAVARAEAMRDKKIASLKQSLAKMEKLEFKA